MANVLDRDIEKRKFEFLLRRYNHDRTNTLGKGMISLTCYELNNTTTILLQGQFSFFLFLLLSLFLSTFRSFILSFFLLLLYTF